MDSQIHPPAKMESFTSYVEEGKLPDMDDLESDPYMCTVHKPNENTDCVHVVVRTKADNEIVKVIKMPEIQYNPARQYCVKGGVVGSFERAESRKTKPLSALQLHLKEMMKRCIALATNALSLNTQCEGLEVLINEVNLAKQVRRIKAEHKKSTPHVKGESA